jgi:thiol-disulfide isomerase/thioredoxin
LTILSLVLPLLAACREGSKPAQPVERVNYVQADPSPTSRTDGFCDVTASGDQARTFRYPELTTAAPASGGRPRWVNVWATWCKPCIEELPLLLGWQAQLDKAGAPFDLVLVSLDGDDEVIRRFRTQHPATPPSLRIKKPELAEAWVVTLGLDKAATIPIHVFVDRQGRIRCARTGSVGRDHLSTVQTLLAGG